MHWLSALSRRLWPAPASGTWDPAVLCADPAVCIIGDLHGRLDLLEQMLEQISVRAGTQPVRRVFVGDMVDRGPDSIGVLRRLHGLSIEAPGTTLCLMGNHERMLLDFLKNPERHGPRWIAAGGTDTLASAGIDPWKRTPMPQLAEQLRTALGPEVLNWLNALPLYWQTGVIGVTHAGASPTQGLPDQSADRLLWGARGVSEPPRNDGMWIAQGHDIVPRVQLAAGRIMVDTGAWRSGILSAVWVDAAAVSVIEVRD